MPQPTASSGPAPLRLGATEWSLIALQSMLWGSAYFFIEIAQPELPPLTIAALRTVPAALTLLVIVLSLGYRLPATLAEWWLFMLFAMFNSILPFALIVWGQARATGGMAAILNASAPLFGIFLAHIITHDEKLSWHKLIGILVGMAGVVVLLGEQFVFGSAADVVARLALLAAPLMYVCANLFARVRLAHYPAFVVAVMQMIGAVLVAMPLAFAIDQPWRLPTPSWAALGAILGMGLFGSAFASLCHFTILQRAGATNASLVTLLIPVTPIALGWVFLGETLTPRDMLGALTIAAALIIIDGRLFGLSRGGRGGLKTPSGVSGPD
jgi:drug/metabolite transporter (DMT)-like permease